MKNALAQLGELGESVWLDDISRGLVSGGALDALMEDGVSGVTSNPAIFKKAIAESGEYDEVIRTLAAGGMKATEIREKLIVEDIVLAADKLASVFVSTRGVDGWVSLEVDPRYAYDTEATVAEALRLKDEVRRPNVMIKVPATDQGVGALRELVSQGVCINMTLIFSIPRYEEVMEAYLAGLESLRLRKAAGEDVPGLGEVHGVASFFVSRIDTAVDERLQHCAASEAELARLRGRAAVASAKRAYRLFQEKFFGSRWDVLRTEGARIQRPLWASTGTKNAAYSDILYVQELIGPNIVSTMPMETIAAFRDHGRAVETVTVDVHGAIEHLKALADVGIDMEEVAAELEQKGVRSFAESYSGLLETLETKMAG